MQKKQQILDFIAAYSPLITGVDDFITIYLPDTNRGSNGINIILRNNKLCIDYFNEGDTYDILLFNDNRFNLWLDAHFSEIHNIIYIKDTDEIENLTL